MFGICSYTFAKNHQKEKYWDVENTGWEIQYCQCCIKYATVSVPNDGWFEWLVMILYDQGWRGGETFFFAQEPQRDPRWIVKLNSVT